MGCVQDAGLEISAEEVRRRFAWARRQGRPAWLWPDVPIPEWRAALGQIEAATVAVLAGETAVVLDGDPSAAGLAGYTSGMGPLLGLWAERGDLKVEQPLAGVLALHLAHNRRRTASMAAAGAGIVGLFAERGIEVVILKGAHTGIRYFPEPGARPASDIDLLVRGRDVTRAELALRDFGLALKGRGRWESSWHQPSGPAEPRSLSFTHESDPWSVDLHGSLDVSAGEGAPAARFDLADPMAAEGRWPSDPWAGVLDQPLLLLHLAAHAGAGWQSLTLLRQVELVLVIRRDAAAGRLAWDAVLDVGARTGALGYAYPALHLAEKLAPGTVPAVVSDACAAQATAAVRRALERLAPACLTG